MGSQRLPCVEQAIHSYNGTLLWKIDDKKRKGQDTINRIKTALYTAPNLDTKCVSGFFSVKILICHCFSW